jgi:hypothetical protein
MEDRMRERGWRGPVGLIGAMLWMGAMSPAWAADAVSVTVVPGELPRVQVSTTGPAVTMPDCRGLVWERFDPVSKGFTPLPSPPCGPTDHGKRLDKEPQTFIFEGEVTEEMVVRAVVVAGLECREGQAFVLADCKKITAWPSATVNVRPRRDDAP